MSFRYPTVEEVLDLHALMIGEFGGSMGLRDMGALESALLRPQIGYYDGLIEEAAALMESLAMNHPFIDGNKRVSLGTTDAFLRDNGYFINCESETAYTFFMQLFETHSFQFTELKPWLEEHVKPF